MALCMALGAMSIDLILPAFPEIREAFGFDAESTAPSQLVTVFFIGMALGQIVYGPLSDRFGRKPLVYAGLALYITGAIAASLAPTFAIMLFFRFLWGFGAAGPRSLILAMVRDTMHGEQMARVMSHVMAVFLIVPVLAPSVGAALLLIAPWQVVLWVPAAAATVLAIWMTRTPETLSPEHRRSLRVRELGDAFRAVVTTGATVVYLVALTLIYALMVSFVGSIEIIVKDVYDKRSLFPVLFGLVGCSLGAVSLLSGRLVVRIGIQQMLRVGAAYVMLTGSVLFLVALLGHGRPPLWAFILTAALLLPSVSVLYPNTNSAALTPLPHVAGMASAVLGTISTGLAAVIGAFVDAGFDGTVLPYATASFVCSLGTGIAILAAGKVRSGRTKATVIPDEVAM